MLGVEQEARARLWMPAVTMLLVSLISYIDRNTLALLAPTILKETRLSAEQYGFIISAFSIAYMASNPIWGRWLDRFGLRAGMMAAVGFWTIASVAHAFAGGFWSFAVARACLGFGEGATFPGGLRAVMQTLPARLRSRGIAVAYSGGSLGAIVTPLIVTPIALWWGWRAGFLFTGFIGLAWLAIWLVVSRRPDVRQDRASSSASESRLSALRFADSRVWSFMWLYALGALPIAFVIYGAAIYLNRALGASQELIGKLLWIPPLGWELGYFFWGWLADRSGDDGARLAGIRRLLAAATVLSLPLAAIPRTGNLVLVMTGLFVAMFVAAGFLILSVAYAIRIYSTSYSGLIAGLGAGAWSAAVACVMPLFGRLFDRHQWQEAFWLAAAAPVAAYVVWRAVNRDRTDRIEGTGNH